MFNREKLYRSIISRVKTPNVNAVWVKSHTDKKTRYYYLQAKYLLKPVSLESVTNIPPSVFFVRFAFTISTYDKFYILNSYYLVSKSKQMIAPKGVFGILNEKRKVLPNRRFCANPNIVLYEDALPTRRPKDTAMREKTSTNSLPVASVAAAGAANASGAGGSGTNTSKTAKTDANGKPTKVVKFEDIMKPLAGGGKPNNENNKSERTGKWNVLLDSLLCFYYLKYFTRRFRDSEEGSQYLPKGRNQSFCYTYIDLHRLCLGVFCLPFLDATAASSAENSDNESVPNSVDDSLDYAMRKARPPTEDFDDDVKEWISKEVRLRCITPQKLQTLKNEL